MYYDGAYGPFGEPYAQSGTADLNFTGMNQDTASNVYDFPAREYGIQGRWPSPDPAGLAAVNPMDPQTWNRYAYVRNNPLGLIDPLGFDTCPPGSPPGATCSTTNHPLPPPSDCEVGICSISSPPPDPCEDAPGCIFPPLGPSDPPPPPQQPGKPGGSPGGNGSGPTPQTPTFKQQYNQCVQGAGTPLKVADDLGAWGLGSLGVTLASSAFTSTMQWIHGTSATNVASTVAQQAPNTAADAGTLANMGEHELFLEGTWATVGKISLWVTAGATAVSGGVRGYCAAKAAF